MPAMGIDDYGNAVTGASAREYEALDVLMTWNGLEAFAPDYGVGLQQYVGQVDNLIIEGIKARTGLDIVYNPTGDGRLKLEVRV